MKSQRIAQFISQILNAPIVCAYALIIYWVFIPSTLNIMSVMGAILFLFVFPWAPVLLFYLKSRVGPSTLSGKKRIPFVFIGFISYIIGAIYFSYVFSNNNSYKFFVALHITYIIFSALLILGNIVSKPSVHMGGFFAPIVLLSLFLGWHFLLLTILSIPIAWSRKELGVHTKNQLITGTFIGIISAIASYFLVFL